MATLRDGFFSRLRAAGGRRRGEEIEKEDGFAGFLDSGLCSFV